MENVKVELKGKVMQMKVSRRWEKFGSSWIGGWIGNNPTILPARCEIKAEEATK